MPKIEWNDELSVGLKEVDDQHKELIRIVNAVIKAVKLGRDQRVVGNVMRKLREYIVFHFSEEEKLMESVRFPDRGIHVSEHARLKREVKDYQRQMYNNVDITSENVLEFLKGWLIGHILAYDRELARFIHTQEEKKRAENEGKNDTEKEKTVADSS